MVINVPTPPHTPNNKMIEKEISKNIKHDTTYPYHVYIVRCNDDSLYTGITNDLERRLRQHNGEMRGGANYTHSRRPVELLYIEKYLTRKEAAQREYEIKHTLNHQQKIELIEKATKGDILKSI